MREEISDSAYELAFEKASPEIILFVSSLSEDDTFINSLINLKISPADARQIKRELVYVALGLARVDEISDNILANTEGDEETISFAINFIEENILPEISEIIQTYQINIKKNPSEGQSGQKRTSADILIKELSNHNEDEGSNYIPRPFIPSKKDLLSEIESPIDTVSKPAINLPKTKPATADILKGLVNAPYTMSDTSKIVEGTQTFTIIDPFKKQIADQKEQDKITNIVDPHKQNNQSSPYSNPVNIQNTVNTRIISSNDPILVPESDITSKISANLDKKFGSITKTVPQQSFRVSQGNDPYREPPRA